MPLPIGLGMLIGGAVSGLGSLGGALFGASSNNRNVDKTNELNLEMMREQNAFNHQEALDQWNRQIEYNSPANQLKLLQQAGINPNGVGWSPNQITQAPASASGLASLLPNSVDPSTLAQSMSAPFVNAINGLKTSQEIRHMAAQADNQIMTNKKCIVSNDLELEQLRNGLLLQDADIRKAVQDISRNAIDLENIPKINKAQLDLLREQIQSAKNGNTVYEIINQWSDMLGYPITPQGLNILMQYAFADGATQQTFNDLLSESTGRSITTTTHDEHNNTNSSSTSTVDTENQNDVNSTSTNSGYSAGLNSDVSSTLKLGGNGKGNGGIGFGADVSSTLNTHYDITQGSSTNQGWSHSDNDSSSTSSSDTNGSSDSLAQTYNKTRQHGKTLTEHYYKFRHFKVHHNAHTVFNR